MITAISRVSMRNGRETDVRAAFVDRPRAVEGAPGFLGLELFQAGASFVLLTRWEDEPSFRAWHDGEEHHAAPWFLPPGIELDPAQTLLIVAERIDAATSEGDLGAMTSDLLVPLARLIRNGGTIHVASLDEAGRVVYANETFRSAAGREIDGVPLVDLVSPPSRANLAERLAGSVDGSILLQLAPDGGEPRSLRAIVRRGRRGWTLVAEPPIEAHTALEATLVSLNSELARLVRENARQARALERTNRELRDAHWHLEKISEVLPICMSCRAVKTGPDTWEDVATFLTKNSDFLSHGYCTRCAQQLLAETD